ncbi:pyrroline-5-carboxylate reductase [Candidatus Berkiella aquae]|uniref:Pyrroline-5-carboxylate reductase n=1 Tax=Candidatus Berkiella aquae TaxID=295108 RepID=A0A0Q9YXC2_9GAMM|nr:pyrroline-5-carboxylate reductase [Candidatus Berkiella aquae]MCS5712611.1 pyrroline-5-carboxylate reductase [Candidatus Berkiella aquae]
MTSQQRIGFIGAGNMGSCLIHGLLKQGLLPNTLWVSDHHLEHLQPLAALGLNTAEENATIATNVDILVLAVKPNSMKSIIEALSAHLQSHRPLMISIAAGITTQQIATWLKQTPCPIVRAMPNTPALLGQGITGLYASDLVNASQQAMVSQLFEAVGQIIWLSDESLMDVVTALSGSGPAYFFYFIECLIEAGVSLGLSEEDARKLTFQTALGAAMMVQNSTESPSVLRQKVTSKGGTTEQGIKVLKDGKIAELLKQMLSAAFERGKTLSRTFD